MEAMMTDEKLNPNVISRLQNSKQKCEDRDYDAGVLEGRRWAEHEAEHEELERLQRAERELDYLLKDPDPAWAVSCVLAGSVDHVDREHHNEFWRGAAGTIDPSTAFLRGWIAGALRVLNLFNEEGEPAKVDGATPAQESVTATAEMQHRDADLINHKHSGCA